jgi:DNA-binding IclR family transcriptional regulator
MSPRKLAPYVLRTLALHQIAGNRLNLQTLVDEIGVRRADVRRTVSALHRQGLVDALRMRPTLEGYAIGRALLVGSLPVLRGQLLAVQAA